MIRHQAFAILAFVLAFAAAPAYAGEKYTVDSPLDRTSDVNEEDFEAFFQSLGKTALKGMGKHYVAIGTKYGIDAVYIMAHASLESGWGTSKIARTKKNLFGYGAYDSNPYYYAHGFPSYREGIDFVMSKVKEDYLTKGGDYWGGAPTLRAMNKKYATDKGWAGKIASIMNMYQRYLEKNGKTVKYEKPSSTSGPAKPKASNAGAR